MGARVAFGWLEGIFRAAWTGEAEDCDDFLAGRDDDLVRRANERKVAVVSGLGVAVR